MDKYDRSPDNCQHSCPFARQLSASIARSPDNCQHQSPGRPRTVTVGISRPFARQLSASVARSPDNCQHQSPVRPTTVSISRPFARRLVSWRRQAAPCSADASLQTPTHASVCEWWCGGACAPAGGRGAGSAPLGWGVRGNIKYY